MDGTHQTDERDRVIALRRAAQANGWDPIPVKTAGKGPIIKNWQARVFDFQSDHAARANLHYGTPHTNTGCRHTTCVAIDVDVDDPDMVDDLRAIVEHIAGQGLVRFRQGSPRCAIFYAKPPDFEQTLQFELASGGLEVRGAPGSQTVIDGTHPSGTPDHPVRYFWEEGTPWDTPLTDLPVLTPAMAEQIVRAAVEAFPPHSYNPQVGLRSVLIDKTGMEPRDAARHLAMGTAGMHDATVAMAGHFALQNWPEGLAEDAIRWLFDLAPPEVRDDRWHERRGDVQRCVRDIFAKHRRSAPSPLVAALTQMRERGMATDEEVRIALAEAQRDAEERS
jgi:hypothetical protein